MTVVFVMLLATPLVLQRLGSRGGPAVAEIDTMAALERHGFYLEEASEEVGIRFTHQAPALDAQLEPIMPVVAAYGASVSIVDFDRDGWSDLYVTNSATGSLNALYRNRGDGAFDDVGVAMGVADLNQDGSGVSMGATWGDYDNDGFEDLFVFKWGRPLLLHNDGGAGFSPVSVEAMPAWINANAAVWFDYDGDSWLDLFVGTFYPADVNLWKLPSTQVMPESFEYAQNGGRNHLFRNLGDGTFEDVTAAVGMVTTRWTLAAAAADIDGDGDQDLFVANDYGVNELYLNEEGRRFREIGRAANVARTPKSGMNASFGDLLNRGDWNIFVTNISEPGVLIHGNDLWSPSTGGTGDPEYRNLAGAMGIELGGFAFGAQFGDLNNDGWLDLFVANGYVTGETTESYWYDYSLVAGGHRNIIADAANWPAMRGRSLSGLQSDRVWLNDRTGRFRDVTAAVADVDALDGRSVAVADLWNRGVLDVVVASQGGPLRVYRNTVSPRHHWIAFALEGRRSNRSAIGAEVRIYRDQGQQIQQIEGGNGFAAQNHRRAHFGLGPSGQIDSAAIRWPSGTRQVIRSPAIDILHQLTEPS